MSWPIRSYFRRTSLGSRPSLNLQIASTVGLTAVSRVVTEVIVLDPGFARFGWIVRSIGHSPSSTPDGLHHYDIEQDAATPATSQSP